MSNCNPNQAEGHRWLIKSLNLLGCAHCDASITRNEWLAAATTTTEAYAHKLAAAGLNTSQNNNPGLFSSPKTKPIGGKVAETTPPRPFQVGDRVRYMPSGYEGDVIALGSDIDLSIRVEFVNGKKYWVVESDLELVAPADNPCLIPVVLSQEHGFNYPSTHERSECTCASLLHGHVNGCPWPERRGKE